ncbi:MAG TPA: haloacid dehalogenase type II [Acetobacteraceae bacterium]|nr:haloacid dehalogenase type II [Acetobacteraceae bacterium]
MPAIRAAIFDAYGTLLDVHAAMEKHAARLGTDWQRISQDWRIKQIEYSWVRSLTGPAEHRDFFTLTTEALHWVAARHGIADRALLADVLDAYRRLSAYPEVPDVLRRLRAGGIGRAILSNGEPSMLADAVGAAGIDRLLDAVLSVEAVGVYKPDPRVYRLASDQFGLAAAEMAFVSSNAWDAFGARVFGFRVFWVNRSGQPDEYGLRGSVQELPDLSGLPDALA